MLSVFPSFAQKQISISQLEDTEWELNTEKGSTRTVIFSSGLAIWSTPNSYGIKERYYLTDEEPIRPATNDEFPFNQALVGRNQKGKYIVVYNNETETTNYYIVKDFTSTYLILEVPASYLWHNNEKVYMSQSRTFTLKLLRKLVKKPQIELSQE